MFTGSQNLLMNESNHPFWIITIKSSNEAIGHAFRKLSFLHTDRFLHNKQNDQISFAHTTITINQTIRTALKQRWQGRLRYLRVVHLVCKGGARVTGLVIDFKQNQTQTKNSWVSLVGPSDLEQLDKSYETNKNRFEDRKKSLII